LFTLIKNGKGKKQHRRMKKKEFRLALKKEDERKRFRLRWWDLRGERSPSLFNTTIVFASFLSFSCPLSTSNDGDPECENLSYLSSDQCRVHGCPEKIS
jgi:hypothetical protein